MTFAISTDGILRGVSADGKRWRVQLERDPAVPEQDWIGRDYLYLRKDGFEQFKILSNIWGDNWAYYESPSIINGGESTSATSLKCGMSFSLKWKVEGTKVTLDVHGIPVKPGMPCNFCVEISDFDGKNRPPEPTVTGDFVRSSENWRVRYWLVRGVSPATSVGGTISWEWGPEARPLFDGPVKEWRKFDYSELPDISPYLGSAKGWGTNICGGAIHRLTEEQVKAECARLKSMGFTTLRLAHFDSFGGSILNDTTGFRRWLRHWHGDFVLDGMHGLGDDTWKGRVWFEPEKWAEMLKVRQAVIDCVMAEGVGSRVVGWVDLNENTVEWPWANRFPAGTDAKALYAKALSLPLPFEPKYRAATQAWGSLPSLSNLALGPSIAGNNYMAKPGVIESVRSLEWFIDQHRVDGKPNWITEWGNATGREIMPDAHLAGPLQSLLCVEKQIGVCCDFAWSQNEESYKGSIKPWEGRLQPSRAMANMVGALIFSRQERGFTRQDGTLRINTGTTFGVVGRLYETDRIRPHFPYGTVVVQELGAGKRLVSVLGRSRGGKMTELELEKVSAVVDGVTYSEGVHLV